MVTATTLGNIMKQGAQVQQVRGFERRKKLAAQGKLMREAHHTETMQILHDIQDVLIHCINVEKIMLHLADNAAESGDISSENAVTIHEPQCLDRVRLMQDLHEALFIGRITAKLAIHHIAIAIHMAKKICAQALQFWQLQKQQEAFENGIGCVLEQSI